MFLMNTSALVALQRKWEPFAPVRNCRYPVCFSESEDDIARSAVSAKVQMIINNLQSEEASLHSHSEYGCVAPKKQKGAKSRGHKLRSGRVLPERATYPQRDCPSDSDGMEVEESPVFGALVLNPDSDDSVDRDIEEAIQEYLKNKGQNVVQPLPSSASSLRGMDSEVSPGCPWPDPACNVFPANVKANVVQQNPPPDCLGDDAVHWAASPCSVSSDDSFEQSINAEIEQFLNEKKQQARKKATAGGSKQLDQKESQEKPTNRSQKEGTNRVSQGPVKRGDKALFFRRHLELQDASTLRGLKSKAGEELADFKTRQAQIKTPLVGHSLLLEQRREGEKRQVLSKGRGEQRPESKDLSDSSSDDGIEEAIQLYQLEKIRKASDSPTTHVPFQKEELRAGRVEDISPYPMTQSVPEIPKKALSGKRKWVASRVGLSRISSTSHNLDNGKIHAPATNSFATCAAALPASCWADSAAELMCAEAILDISKTILPPPVGSSPLFCSQDMPASEHDSDSNAVDSDDSIEQEIRAFLALKAQTKHLITQSRVASCSIQIPPSSGQPEDQSRSLKLPSPKSLTKRLHPLNLSLNLSPRKLKGESKTFRETQGTQLSEIHCRCMGSNHSKVSTSQEEGISAPQNSDAQRVAKCQQDPLATGGSVDFANPLSQGILGFGKNARQRPQKCGLDDKSSSLDSDEDLDIATKELLRSKRKLKRKSKDQKCKKKARFCDSETHALEDKEKDCKSKKNPLLRSCLMNPQRDVRMESAASLNVVKGKPKGTKTIQFEFKKECQTKPSSEPDTQETSKNNQNLWTSTSLTDESSSVDSDDSIEQEIQRFLAEKSKDSTVSTDIPGIVQHLGIDKPQTAASKAKCQQFQGGGNALSKWSGGKKKGTPPKINLQNSLRPEKETVQSAPQVIPYTQYLCSHTAVNSEAGQGVVNSQHPGSPVKESAEERKIICAAQLDQRSLPPGKDKIGHPKWQNCFRPLSPVKQEDPLELRIPSGFTPGPKSPRSKKQPVLWGGRQSPGFSFFKRQGNVSVANWPARERDERGRFISQVRCQRVASLPPGKQRENASCHVP